MIPILRQEVTRDFVKIVKAGGEEWTLTRDQVLAMLQAQPRQKVIDAVRESLGLFLEIDPADLTRKVLFNALQTGEMALGFAFDD